MFKKITRRLITLIQKILLNVSLFLVYYLFFGITVGIAFLFNRRLLKPGKKREVSAWLAATGYENDPANSRMQS